MIMKRKNKRKICVVTGSRAEYGLLRPVMLAIRESRVLSLYVIACGMHLVPEFGLTYRNIEKDGFLISDRVEITPVDDSVSAMAESIGLGVVGMTKALDRINPDIVLFLGDRFEIFASAIAAAYSCRVVAHIHGGDSARSGLDESTRHAITKLAHIHFPATRKSAQRIKRMGEDPRRIFVVGAPGLDSILHTKLVHSSVISKKYGLDRKNPFLLIAQHPVTTEPLHADEQMRKTLKAVQRIGYQTVIIYPNIDAGGRSIIGVINEYSKKFPFMRSYKSVPHAEYLSLLRDASVMVGNSSSGIVEASSFHVPVVDIGIRQEGRECAMNVIHVPHSVMAIEKAINFALFNKKFAKKVQTCKSTYGNGVAGVRIAGILAKISITKNTIKKKITY